MQTAIKQNTSERLIWVPADQSPAWERPLSVHSCRPGFLAQRQEWVVCGIWPGANIRDR